MNRQPGITGIGGIFFKSKNPEQLKQWYRTHLGLKLNDYGAMFAQGYGSDRKEYLQWSPMPETTDYFKPSDQPFMINFRVQELEALVAQLKAADVPIVDEIATYEYGKFVHVLDPEGNNIELWEPIDSAFDSTHPEEKLNF